MELEDLGPSARDGNVAALFDETAEHHGDAVAVEHHGERTTHSQLSEKTAEFAGGLHELGVEPGDKMLVYLPNRPEYLVASLGALKAGVVVSPVNPQYKRRELSYQMKDSDASVVVTHPALRPIVSQACDETGMEPHVVTVDQRGEDDDTLFEEVHGEPTLLERDGSDVALLPYTSGTTGRPKGVRLTHDNFRAHMYSALAPPHDIESEEVRSLIWLPLYHITGFTHTACQPLVRGGGLYLRSAVQWDGDEAMNLIEEEGITHFVGVTAMYVDIVNSEEFGNRDLTSLEMAAEGGAKMSEAVQREFEETAGVDMTEGYGLTETAGATHSQSGSTFGLEHGTVGQPLRMFDAKILDEDGKEVPVGEEGELLVRGPSVMDGYHGMPEATDEAFTEDGYFRTGDIARRDGKNYYEIVDRKKHVIVSAGYNIYPSEVEELLAEHDNVAEAAVVGIEDERRNEVPIAYVVPAPDVEPGEDLTADRIKEYSLERIAEYKHPREVRFVEELPRTTSGKIRKFKLEERYENENEDDG